MIDPKELERLASIGACLVGGLPFDKAGNARIRYVSVAVDGTSCVCTPAEAVDMIGAEPDAYTLTDIFLSEEEFDALPEFDGF